MTKVTGWCAHDLVQASQARADAVLDLARAFLALPGVVDQGDAFGRLLLETMRGCGFVDVARDGMGNCLGRIRGRGLGPSILVVCPLDAPAGPVQGGVNESSGEGSFDGVYVRGWGACANKGALASVLQAGALLFEAGLEIPGDLIVVGVVQSEARAEIGVRHVLEQTLLQWGWHADLVVLAHPTGLGIVLGQRGYLSLELTLAGRAMQAEWGHLAPALVNRLPDVLARIASIATQMPRHSFLEPASIGVTSVRTVAARRGMLPDRLVVGLERRWLPQEDVDGVIWQMHEGLSPLWAQSDDCWGSLAVATVSVVRGEGVVAVPRVQQAFLTDRRHGLVVDVMQALRIVGQNPEVGKWVSSYDGGYPAALKKITTIGYGPGHPALVYTLDERVALKELVAATAGYAAIAVGVAGVLNH